MTPSRATIWNAATKQLTTKVITSEDELVSLAEQLLRQQMGKDATLPGFELSTDNENWGQLAVALAPYEWALVHTAPDHITQRCTYSSLDSNKDSVNVQWDEITSVPGTWFIPRQQALDGIGQWLKDGTLSATIHWSDQCY